MAEVLTKNADSIARKAGEPVEVKYILGRHDYPDSPFRDLVVTDFSIIENDPEVTVVAECIGGTGAARDYTLRALKAGKSVVTSNKEVVAECGDEFFAIAREKNLNYLYEASVGGGIPIIRPLGSCLAANEITEIYGILNGTTNYILTKMIKEGLSFDTALAQAQEKGYAEADPTADVEGFDACRKICILASLSFGRHIYPAQVPTQGITGITSEDVALAEAAGMKIKLLGRAVRQEDGKVVAYVAPHLIPEDQQLAGVEDVFNGIVVRGDAHRGCDVLWPGRRKAAPLPVRCLRILLMQSSIRNVVRTWTGISAAMMWWEISRPCRSGGISARKSGMCASAPYSVMWKRYRPRGCWEKLRCLLRR